MAEYISRHEAIRAAQINYGDYCATKSALCNIPAADVSPVRHGRWEPYFEYVEIYNTGGFCEKKQTGWICGRCKSKESITKDYKTHFCPNCGAKMDGEPTNGKS